MEKMMQESQAKTMKAMVGGMMEECFGVSLKAHCDCCADTGTRCVATNTTAFQGNAFKLEPTGLCTTIQTPNGAGSLTAKT